MCSEPYQDQLKMIQQHFAEINTIMTEMVETFCNVETFENRYRSVVTQKLALEAEVASLQKFKNNIMGAVKE